MIFRMGVISRRGDLDHDGFTQHWRAIHGGLARKLPGLLSYRQNHIRERIHEAANSPLQQIDGLSQLRFNDVAAMEVAETSPEYAACKLDIPKFQGAITILVLSPTELLPATRRGNSKLLWVSRLRPTLSVNADWREKWSEGARSRLVSVPEICGAIQNFVIDKSHPVAAGVQQGEPAADTVTEIWFENDKILHATLASAGAHALIFDDPLLEPLAVYQVDEVTIL